MSTLSIPENILKEAYSHINDSNKLEIKHQKLFQCLDLTTFKTVPCKKKYKHDHKMCFNFHGKKDCRRVPVNYSSEMCKNQTREKDCPLGHSCKKCHNTVEHIYREEKYKKKLCNYYPNNISECEYNEFCCYAHNEIELQVLLYHKFKMDVDFFLFYYKTSMCPYNHSSESEKEICLYSHNENEFRRSLINYDYQPFVGISINKDENKCTLILISGTKVLY